MDLTLLPQLALYALTTLWTPGPNNTMLAASGARFGFRASVPHASGVAMGFPVMLFLICLGLGELFRASSLLRETLRWGGVAVMLWLSWKIATSGRAEVKSSDRPFSFLAAAGFQWINPKAWLMAIGVATTYASGSHPIAEAAMAMLVFAALGLTSSFGWMIFGAAIARLLKTERRLRAFNIAMGALLAVTTLSLLWADLRV